MDRHAAQNASSTKDWERHNIIERTGDAVHIYCDLLSVQHGNLGNDADGDDLATLMVFRFRFGTLQPCPPSYD